MPVKRRVSKRRVDPAREFKIWSSVLEAGFDFFDDLASLGIDTDENGRPDRAAAAEAWALHGERILAEQDPRNGPAWALEEFGRTWERTRGPRKRLGLFHS